MGDGVPSGGVDGGNGTITGLDDLGGVVPQPPSTLVPHTAACPLGSLNLRELLAA